MSYDPKDLPFAWMQGLQLDKLSTPKNMAKKHWLDLDIEELLQLLKDEVKELTIEIQDNAIAERIIDECLDVANLATMIAHFAREGSYDQLRPSGPDLPARNGGVSE